MAFLISSRRLAAFGDRFAVRDPRARSLRPSLVPAPGGLEVRGPFQLRRHLVPTRARGVAFVDATGDPNPIHRTGEVVPGAFVAAQVVASAEVLFEGLHLEHLRATFNGVCWYGRSLRLVIHANPSGDELSFAATAYQDRREVATIELAGRLAPRPPVALRLGAVDGVWLMRVVSCYAALGIDAEAKLHPPSGPDLSYPISFLASLPSGTMVERLAGEGGLLNRLTLSFGPHALPISGPPEVSLELPKRLRASFNRIVTAVQDGVRTAVSGTALVARAGLLPERE